MKKIFDLLRFTLVVPVADKKERIPDWRMWRHAEDVMLQRMTSSGWLRILDRDELTLATGRRVLQPYPIGGWETAVADYVEEHPYEFAYNYRFALGANWENGLAARPEMRCELRLSTADIFIAMVSPFGRLSHRNYKRPFLRNEHTTA